MTIMVIKINVFLMKSTWSIFIYINIFKVPRILLLHPLADPCQTMKLFDIDCKIPQKCLLRGFYSIGLHFIIFRNIFWNMKTHACLFLKLTSGNSKIYFVWLYVQLYHIPLLIFIYCLYQCLMLLRKITTVSLMWVLLLQFV